MCVCALCNNNDVNRQRQQQHETRIESPRNVCCKTDFMTRDSAQQHDHCMCVCALLIVLWPLKLAINLKYSI